jgi:outer membrane protein OmpA-like peptidoglycan-associated protein
MNPASGAPAPVSLGAPHNPLKTLEVIMKFYRTLPLASAFLLAQAQVPMPTPTPTPMHLSVAATAPAPVASPAPAMVKCSIEAINYRLLTSSTRIEFQGTTLLPEATGVAKVKTKEGISTIKAKFANLPEASTFGEACLTYVLWAVSPEGQTANLGELQVKKGKSKIKVTEQMPAFGLMITAEPYFAVTRPSDAVVLKNAIGKETKGKVELVEAKLELMPQKQYVMNLASAPPPAGDPDAAMPMLQARQAVRIALGAGAASYAKDALGKAENYLQQSEAREGGEKNWTMTARSATQSAEEARLMAVRGHQAELDAVAAKVAQARLDEAKEEAARAALAKEDAVKEAQATEQENEGLRTQLMAQLSGILETKETARGLIVSMSGVLFKTGQATLAPAAREKLAKVAGILATHKGLRIEADGFTDSTGPAPFNERLSESRAQAARDFLVSQGVAADAIVSRGFGSDHPIAGNDTEAGRMENRRVELVVSGEGITAPTPKAPESEHP